MWIQLPYDHDTQFHSIQIFAPKNIKINTYKIEIDCECGKPNAIENMIWCEGIKSKKIAMYGSIGLVQETWKVTPGIKHQPKPQTWRK